MSRPSKYPEEFRREAVEWYRSSDRRRCQVAKSLGDRSVVELLWIYEANQPDQRLRSFSAKPATKPSPETNAGSKGRDHRGDPQAAVLR